MSFISSLLSKIFAPFREPHLARVLKVKDGEIAPRKNVVQFPTAAQDQMQRSQDIHKYFEICDTLGRKPSQSEWGGDFPDGVA